MSRKAGRRSRRRTGSDLTQVVGILANMVPYRCRSNLDTDRERINIDDADMLIGEAANPWGTVVDYGNLVHDFCREILEGGAANQGDFAQSARVQEIINAVALSHRERRWVELPLTERDRAGSRDGEARSAFGRARE